MKGIQVGEDWSNIACSSLDADGYQTLVPSIRNFMAIN